MDYNTDLKIISRENIGIENAKKMIQTFLDNEAELDGIKRIGMEELMKNL